MVRSGSIAAFRGFNDSTFDRATSETGEAMPTDSTPSRGADSRRDVHKRLIPIESFPTGSACSSLSSRICRQHLVQLLALNAIDYNKGQFPSTSVHIDPTHQVQSSWPTRSARP